MSHHSDKVSQARHEICGESHERTHPLSGGDTGSGAAASPGGSPAITNWNVNAKRHNSRCGKCHGVFSRLVGALAYQRRQSTCDTCGAEAHWESGTAYKDFITNLHYQQPGTFKPKASAWRRRSSSGNREGKVAPGWYNGQELPDSYTEEQIGTTGNPVGRPRKGINKPDLIIKALGKQFAGNIILRSLMVQQIKRWRAGAPVRTKDLLAPIELALHLTPKLNMEAVSEWLGWNRATIYRMRARGAKLRQNAPTSKEAKMNAEVLKEIREVKNEVFRIGQWYPTPEQEAERITDEAVEVLADDDQCPD
jgi:hypothetical protein